MKGLVEQTKLAGVFKKIRLANKMTQEDLACALYCDVRQVRRYETVGTDKITIVNLYAEIFNLDTLSILSMASDAF